MKPVGFITKDEATLVLGCTRRTVDNLMARGLIPFYKFGRSVFFKRDEILATLDQYRVPAWGLGKEPKP